MPHSETANGRYKVQVLDRTFGILEVLAAHGKEVSLVELSRELNLHKSTVHRLVSVLECNGYVDKNPDNGRYRLGLRLFEMGSKAVANLDVRERARPKLERLAFQTNETVHLCVMDRDEVLYIEKVEPDRSVRLSTSVGRRMAPHCTSVGKAMLAHMSEERVLDIVRRKGLAAITPHTITRVEQLREDLDGIRAKGFSIDDEEFELGVRCVAAPIRDWTGQVSAAISISGPTFRITPEHLPALAEAVKAVAAEVSAELGCAAQTHAAGA